MFVHVARADITIEIGRSPRFKQSNNRPAYTGLFFHRFEIIMDNIICRTLFANSLKPLDVL